MRRRAPFRVVIGVSLILAGCATPMTYGPIGSVDNPYGYRETPNPDGSITLLVVSNSAPLAHEYWDRRAREICGGADFHKNIFRAEIPVGSYTGYVSGANGYGGSYTESRYGSFYLEGYLRCGEGPLPATPSANSPPPATAPVQGTP